jgi:hypothetical protein
MKTLCAFAVFCAGTMASASSVGTVPRSSPAQYSAHAAGQLVSIGAVKLNHQQVRKAFTSDLNRCCVVLEVAIYPAKDHSANVSLSAFSLRVVNSKDAVHPSSGKVVASSLQKSAGSRDVTVSPAVGVGYGTGGYEGPRQRGGVYTSTGVAVGIGNPGNQPGSTEADRKAMELELSEKGLPEGAAFTPVAGHLYFPFARKKNVRYELEYTVDGEKVVLSLPE